MTRAAALMIVLTMYAAARAESGTPSTTVLADMGITGMQILSDHEAATIRGHGFEPGSQLAGFEHYQQSKAAFKGHVAEFRKRIKNHTFPGNTRFKNSI